MFVYKGDPRDPKGMPESVDMFGIHFTKGEPVKVEDSATAKKLQGNSHFEEVDGRVKQKADGG